MKVSIRKSKHSQDDLSINDIKFGSECVQRFINGEYDKDAYMIYTGMINLERKECNVYRTKTQISAIVM